MRLVNLTLDSYNILIGILLFISISLRHVVNTKVKLGFQSIVIMNIAMAATHVVSLIFQGSTNPASLIIFQISVFVFYLLSFTVLVASGVEIMFYLNLEKYRKAFLAIAAVFLGIYCVLLVLTPFSGLLYVIDENNTLVHGNLYNFYLGFQLVLYFNTVFYLLLNNKSINKEHITFLVSFMLFPQLMQFVQIGVHGIALTNTGFTISFLKEKAIAINESYKRK